jgi:D-sedoheptulose 7-phosphate isomerase
MNPDFFKHFNELLTEAINSVDNSLLAQVADQIKQTAANGKKIIIVGNGGSAAMASHVSVDLTKTVKCRSVNFNEADLLTCFANDFGYENWVEKAIEYYADAGDMAIMISSSGNSMNIIKGARKAMELGVNVVTLSGFSPDNPLRSLGNINLWVNSKGYNIVEMAHHIWLVAIVDYIVGKIEYTSN